MKVPEKPNKRKRKRLPKKYYAILVQIVFLLLFFLAAAAAQLVYEEGPLHTSAAIRLNMPSSEHLFGTDEYGRDILSRVCYGLRNSLLIGVSVVCITTVLGVAVGTLCGWNDKADRILSRILDAFMAFPEIILAITLAAIWGAGTGNLIFALSFAFFPKMTRVVRSSVIRLRAQEHVESGRAIGVGTAGLILKYILPGGVSAIIVQATFCFASAILSEAALSFLGVGIKDPAPSLGGMVSTGRNYMTIAPWTILIPGAVIMLLVLTLNLLGDSLRDLLDPKYQLNSKYCSADTV